FAASLAQRFHLDRSVLGVRLWPIARTRTLSPERAFRTHLAKRIIDAFFVRTPVDLFHHRKASDAFPLYNLNPSVLEFGVVTQVYLGRLSKPFVQLRFGAFRSKDAKDSL